MKNLRIYKGKSEGLSTPSAFKAVWGPRGWKIKAENKPATEVSGLTRRDTGSEVPAPETTEKKEGDK